MTNQASSRRHKVPSQEGSLNLTEQDLQKATGGGIGNLEKPLLSPTEKIAAGKEYPHPNNGTYHPPSNYGTYHPPSDLDLLRQLGVPYTEGMSVTESLDGKLIKFLRRK